MIVLFFCCYIHVCVRGSPQRFYFVILLAFIFVACLVLPLFSLSVATYLLFSVVFVCFSFRFHPFVLLLFSILWFGSTAQLPVCAAVRSSAFIRLQCLYLYLYLFIVSFVILNKACYVIAIKIEKR